MAVKLTTVPAQIFVALAETETAGVTDVLTLIVIEFEETVLMLLQAALEVTLQVITSLLANDEEV